MKLNPFARTVILGATQTGKSYYIKHQIIPKLLNITRVVIFDLKFEYLGPYAKDTEAYCDTPNAFIVHGAKGLAEAMSRGARLVVVQPDITKVSLENTFADVSKYIYSQENLVFIVDEIQAVTTKNKICKEFKGCVCQKQAQLVGIIAASQRSATGVHNDIMSQTTTIISFAQVLKADISSLADLCGKDLAAQVASPEFRENRNFLYISTDGTMKVMQSPKSN